MKRRKQSGWGAWGLVLAVLLTGGSGYLAYERYLAPNAAVKAEAVQPELETATVTRGDIIISVTGAGELVPAAELELGFRTGGVLAQVLVEVADNVEEGDVLARLETAALERSLAQAEVELQIAEYELASAQQGATEAELASAEASLRDAQVELTLAQNAYVHSANSRLDGLVESAKVQYDYWVGYYQHQKAQYEEGRLSQADHDWAMAAMIDAEGRWQAAINDAKVEEVEAGTRIEAARNAVDQAERKLELLHSEPMSDTVVRAMLAADQAHLAREKAAEALDAARLIAPFSGVVMGVTASAGEQVATDVPIIVLADLQEPVIQLWVEEGGMNAAVVGHQVTVAFEAIPDRTFAGEIVRVDPLLTAVESTSAVQCLAALDLGDQAGVTLRKGMTAEVEVLVAEARDALLVPVEALREMSPGQYVVFVVGSDGQLEMRAVAVGLMDYVNAEIVAGLTEGDVVSLGEAG